MLKEAQYALRSIRKTPGLSLTIILTLALCISATASVGNLINGYFQRLPIPDAREVVGIYTGGPNSGPYGRTSYLDYQDYLDAESLSGVAGSASFGSNLNYQGETSWVWGATVTGSFFEVLEIQPAAGRFFDSNEQDPGGAAVAVLSHRLWKSRFQGDLEIIGTEVTLNRRSFTIIGVAPRSFVGLNAFYHPDLWAPIHHADVLFRSGSAVLEDRSRPLLALVGRLDSDATMETALQELSSIAQQLEVLDPRVENPRSLIVLPAYHAPPSAREWYLPTAKTLLVAVAFLLLIGCFNVANLLYAKALARQKEMATRLALGGGRWSLVRLIFLEVFYLAGIAGVLALLSTIWTGARISAYFAPPVQGARGAAPLFQPDFQVLALVAGLVCAVTTIVALIPAFKISRTNLAESLQRNTGNFSARRRMSTGSFLLALQVALSMALLTGTALMWQSMANILNGDPGYSLDNVVVASIRLPIDRYPTPDEGARFYRDLMDQVLEAGGVESVSLAEVAPLSGFSRADEVLVPDLGEEPIVVDRSIVGPRYFDTLGIEFVDGRSFGLEHDRTTRSVVVVNETLVRKVFDNQSGVGRELLVHDTPFTIIGVVEDTKYLSLQEEPRALAYFSFYQRFAPNLNLVVRSEQPIEGLASHIRDAVRKIDVEAAVLFVTSLRQWLEGSIWEPRLRTDVLRVVGLIALMLSGIGVFGLMQHRIVMEFKELGVRLAVGASRVQILFLVLSRGAWIGAVGALLGLPLAYLAGRLVESFLHGVGAFDPAILTIVILALSLVILLGAFVPALRAARLDPLTAIRHD